MVCNIVLVTRSQQNVVLNLPEGGVTYITGMPSLQNSLFAGYFFKIHIIHTNLQVPFTNSCSNFVCIEQNNEGLLINTTDFFALSVVQIAQVTD